MAIRAGNSSCLQSWTGLSLFFFVFIVLMPSLAFAGRMSDGELGMVTAAGGTGAKPEQGQTGAYGGESSPVVMIGSGDTAATENSSGDAVVHGSSEGGGEGPARTEAAGYYGYSVVGAGAVYSLESKASVSISGSAQAGARALNLVNAASGDASSVVNLWVPAGERPPAAGKGFELNQANSIDQVYGRGSALSRWVSGPDVSTSSSESFLVSAISSSFVRDTERLRTVSGQTVEATAKVSVDNPSITIPNAITPEPLSFGFDVKKTVRVPDPKALPGDNSTDFTFNFSVTGAELRLPTVDLTGPAITADSAVVRLPDINLGSVFVKRGTPDSDGNCSAVKGCIRRSFDLGTLKGRELTLDGPIEIFRNPFYGAEIDIPVGVGAAGYGTGTATFGESSDRLSFAARLDLSSLLRDLDLDLFDLLADGVDLPVVGEDSELVGAPDLTDFFPEVEFNPVVFEQTNPGFTLEAEGDNTPLCGGGNATCSGETSVTSSEATVPEKTVESGGGSSSAEFRSREFSASYRSVAAVAEAEGGYIVVGGGDVDVSREAAIGLGGRAQSGMAVINSVNASATVVGNALNVGGMGRSGRSYPVPAGANQGNSFNQRR